MAADDAGVVYLAAGAPARVYRITPDGKSTIIFEPKELQVQTLRIGPTGAIYAATAPEAEDGGYYGPQGFEEMRGDTVGPAKIAAQARDTTAASRLWSICEQLTGIHYL